MFFVTSAGKPFAEKNRRTGRIPNSWNSLLKRVQDDSPDFKRLSFKYLLKTGSDFVRAEGGGELASTYLAHGRPYGRDEHLDDYTNRPYGKMFEILDLYYDRLSPVWDQVEDPFPAGRKLGGKDKLPPSVIREMKKLTKEGVGAVEIARKFGVNRSTVYRKTKGSSPRPR